MDVLRKELNYIYESQNLRLENLDSTVKARLRQLIEAAAMVDGDCRVLTDASADSCLIIGGRFAVHMGLCDSDPFFREADSSDEDAIYPRMHPEDLVDKRMLEYEFFKFIDGLPDNYKTDFTAICHIRLKDRSGRYIFVDNSTRVMQLSPNGRIWLILCRYTLSPVQEAAPAIAVRILHCATGQSVPIILADRRDRILTPREKEILSLIRDGKLSKQIAADLGISIHTVNRHRQNILEKLSVGNSVEAITAASLMKLF